MTNAKTTTTILVVDDEPDIAGLVSYHLARSAYRVRTAADGMEALQAVDLEAPDLIVLDLMLPNMGGLEVLRELKRRPETAAIPTILLSAKREDADRIEGLRMGADDYIGKPFSPNELILRIAAVLRRIRQQVVPGGTGRVIRIGDFVLDEAAVSAAVRDQPLDLTPTEFRLLHMLMERRGRVQSREQLLASVWGVTARITTRTVDMHVQRLRGKLGDDGDRIETVRGFGYRFRQADPTK